MNTILDTIRQDPRLAVFVLACILTLSNVVTFACCGNDPFARRNTPLRVTATLTVLAWLWVWSFNR